MKEDITSNDAQYVAISQGDSVQREKKDVDYIPQEEIPTIEGLTGESKPKRIRNRKKPPLEKRVKVEPYRDPAAKPPLTYRYKKIVIKPNETENEEINKILNECASIIRFEEKIQQDGSVIVFLIYTEKPKEVNKDA